jgi:hypothetical protein
MIWTRESALCKLRKKYGAKMKEVCQLDSNSDTVSFNFFECRYFKIFGIYCLERYEPKGRRVSSKENILAVSILKGSPRS